MAPISPGVKLPMVKSGSAAGAASGTVMCRCARGFGRVVRPWKAGLRRRGGGLSESILVFCRKLEEEGG